MKIFKELIGYVLIIVFVVLIRTFIVTPVIVSGASMSPTLKNNQVLILNKLDKSYKRFDIVVIDYNNEKLIKRVIGLPGEIVKYKNGKLYINNKKVNDKHASITADFLSSTLGTDTIPTGYYLVMGDNRNNSIDSRVIGLISSKDILGTTSFRIFPFDKIGSID